MLMEMKMKIKREYCFLLYRTILILFKFKHHRKREQRGLREKCSMKDRSSDSQESEANEQ